MDADWQAYGLKCQDGKSSLVYYPEYMTVKELADAVKEARKVDKKTMIQIPHHLPKNPFHLMLWSFD